jgi:septal ring factor EnvC (AmiA/AmiB activator)
METINKFRAAMITHTSDWSKSELVGVQWVELLIARATTLHLSELASLRDELKETKTLLAYKNDTANTFMSQIKRLQAEVAVLREAIREANQALRTAINTVECDSVDDFGNELPWYKQAKKALTHQIAQEGGG